MFSKIVLPIVVVIGAATAALAGPKDPLWPTTANRGATTQERQIPADTYMTFASTSRYPAPAHVPAMWAHSR
jgi:hypothetical protein